MVTFESPDRQKQANYRYQINPFAFKAYDENMRSDKAP